MARKKNKGNLPSQDDAASAMNFIKEKQAEADSIDVSEKQRRAAEQQEKERQIAEQRLIAEIKMKVDRKLKENLLKKRKAERREFIIKELESGNKITWLSKDNGYLLKGSFEDKELFEVKRGLTLFSLYLKTEIIIKEIVLIEGVKTLVSKKVEPSYLGCSTNLRKLKDKSEQLIELINLVL